MSLEEEIDALADRLRPHYSRFLEGAKGDVLLTGHSHQAWPDRSREGQIAAWDDAARLADRKWGRILGEILPEFQARVASRLGSARPLDIAYGQNTHELILRLASALPRRSILSTDSEFHSLERQLSRWSEDGVEVRRVPVEDGAAAGTFADRFIEAAERSRPSWAALSYVMFTTARVIVDLPRILEALAKMAIPVLVDCYHAFNALDLSVDAWPGEVFIAGGGYKYAECGEGACFMLVPPGARALRPVETGWFSHFAGLEADRKVERRVEYGEGGQRFMGATFDPTSLYRAVWVLRFLDEQGLSPKVLREQSVRQTSLIFDAYGALGLESRGFRLMTPEHARGGFVAISMPGRASEISERLLAKGIRTDHRGDLLRLGPAPYVRSSEITRAMDALAEVSAVS